MIYINDEKFIPQYFPDDTFRLNYEVKSDKVIIKWLFEKNEEMSELYFITKHIKQYVKDVTLYMPYIPNARMDRVKGSDEVFTLKYFCEFINSLEFSKVYVRDAHSNVSLALLNNVVNENVFDKITSLADKLLSNDNDIIFFPDEGAYKRYSKDLNRKCAFGIKEREWSTGKILDLKVEGKLSNKFDVLIVDDICSYGNTFLYSAKKLKELGANKVWLYITHCEKNIFNGDLYGSGLIEKVYTTGSIFNEENDWVEII